ncbi:MAG: acetate--CoA ligase family protein, partial [Hyphomicrobiaceae bacterium]
MEPTAIIDAALVAGREALTEAEGKDLLSACGIAVPKSVVVADTTSVEDKCTGMHAPFACKVVSPDILHKSDAGGVMLNLADSTAVTDAIASMSERPAIRAANVEGWLVEEMIPAGREFVVGAYRDPQFGPMMMVGLGGIFVEILEDVAFGVCPIDKADAHDMIDRLRAAPLLDGARGERPVDRSALVDIMLRLGGKDGLMMHHGAQISEVDINPVIVSDAGACAADARFILDAAPSTVQERKGSEPDASRSDFRPLFEPQCIAVLGASTTSVTMANTFIRRMKAYDYGGELVAIHPTATEVEGIPAYADITSTPQPIDYAYIAVAANRIPAILGSADGRCRFAQVISSGFGEIDAGRALEEELVANARQAGVRVLGPNCLGTYSPRGGLTFPADAPKETGTIGVISQSGGLSTDIIKRGQWRGLCFSGLVTIGNSADVKP